MEFRGGGSCIRRRNRTSIIMQLMGLVLARTFVGRLPPTPSSNAALCLRGPARRSSWFETLRVDARYNPQGYVAKLTSRSTLDLGQTRISVLRVKYEIEDAKQGMHPYSFIFARSLLILCGSPGSSAFSFPTRPITPSTIVHVIAKFGSSSI